MLLAIVSESALAAGGGPVLVEDVSRTPKYLNKVAQVTLAQDYVEICFRNGVISSDVHVGGGGSAGGNCLPGSVGFILDLVPRAFASWQDARASCLADGMRLPERFELLYACSNAVGLGFASNLDVVGWASNETMWNVMNGSLDAFLLDGSGAGCVPLFKEVEDTQEHLCAL